MFAISTVFLIRGALVALPAVNFENNIAKHFTNARNYNKTVCDHYDYDQARLQGPSHLASQARLFIQAFYQTHYHINSIVQSG